jgi:Mg2+-importing ATPase
VKVIYNAQSSQSDESLHLNTPLSTEESLNLPLEKIFEKLDTSIKGLSCEEAAERIETYGYNEFTKRKKKTIIFEFFSHLSNPLLIILLFAGIISGVLGETINSAIILSIVVISIGLDLFQESKAEKAAELLKSKVATTATVVRDGLKKEVKLSEIVPGDIILLSAGDIIPADARIINAKDLFINQSSLTGESFPVEKIVNPPSPIGASISEWTNYLFMGTSVVSGTGIAVVVKTGNRTEFGKISKKLVERSPETEFDRGLRKFGFLILQVIFMLVLFVFFINALFKQDVLEALLFAVALAVGMSLELLPMVLSINLSRGALAMSKKGVIVKRLPAIQNFGSMDILCTDKTGTLTDNKIALVRHIDSEAKSNDKVLLYSFLNSFYQTGLKSPLDEAILGYRNVEITKYEKVDEIPFDFNRKRVSVIVDRAKERFLVTKGAPEEINRLCIYCDANNQVFDMTPELQSEINRIYHELSVEGFRVLSVAYKRIRQKKTVYTIADEKDLVFLGFVAFIDPPKESAQESVRLLNKAGVELKILTGDNEQVTRKTCMRIGLEVKGVVLGSQMLEMDDEALARVVEKNNIFARVSPAQKDRIMIALKNNGHVVGFLGDGINDAPSLKTADVGISVDNAVDVAKEAADIILLKKDLTVLDEGILEGRKTFANTMKYIIMGTSSNFGGMFSVAIASLFLPFLPMLPIQILLNNLLYDISQSTIPTDNVDAEYVEKPKKLNVSYIRKYMLVFGPISSLFDFLTFFTMLYLFNANAPLFQTAWFMESLATQALIIFVIRTNKTPFYKSKPSKLLLLSTIGIVGLNLILPFTPIGKIFGLVEPPLLFYVALAAIISGYLICVEVVKKIFHKKYPIS